MRGSSFSGHIELPLIKEGKNKNAIIIRLGNIVKSKKHKTCGVDSVIFPQNGFTFKDIKYTNYSRMPL